jgi:alpha-beta hydrolase superfamily lysophospholipase
MIILLRGSLLVVLGAYLITLIAAAFFSDRIIFRPQQAGYRDHEGILKLASSGGAKISAAYLANPEAVFTVLFSHGNAQDIGDAQPLLERIRAEGFAVFAYDYQGYGTSEGRPSQRHAYEDEDAAYNFLVESMHVQPNRIIAYGHSVGSGPACDLASRRPLAGLILESAFTSAFRVMTRVRVLPFDKFDNLSKIKSVRCPVLVMHGTEDSVIKTAHGKKLFAAANQPKQALWVEGANHNDVASIGGARYSDALKTFATLIRQLQAQASPAKLIVGAQGDERPIS